MLFQIKHNQTIFRWVIRFGDSDLDNNEDDVTVVERQVLKVDFHPKYKKSTVYFDIAILKFEKVAYTIFVRPGNLSCKTRLYIV